MEPWYPTTLVIGLFALLTIGIALLSSPALTVERCQAEYLNGINKSVELFQKERLE